jgi:hypothetical protein
MFCSIKFKKGKKFERSFLSHEIVARDPDKKDQITHSDNNVL